MRVKQLTTIDPERMLDVLDEKFDTRAKTTAAINSLRRYRDYHKSRITSLDKKYVRTGKSGDSPAMSIPELEMEVKERTKDNMQFFLHGDEYEGRSSSRYTSSNFPYHGMEHPAFRGLHSTALLAAESASSETGPVLALLEFSDKLRSNRWPKKELEARLKIREIKRHVSSINDAIQILKKHRETQ
jgi:hypothetical protein